eukprot:2791567-Ditylum_brightwellii.AAC.1
MEEKGRGSRGSVLGIQWRSDSDENIINKSVLKRTLERQQCSTNTRRSNGDNSQETFQERRARIQRNEVIAELDRISNPFDQSLLAYDSSGGTGPTSPNTNHRDDAAAYNASTD